jgi:predicted nucleic acid-binding protein
VAHYVDSSALVKMVVDEVGSEALRTWLEAHSHRGGVSSVLTSSELFRAVRRGAPERLTLAREVLDKLTVIDLPTTVFEQAGRLEPIELRTLDALHLAAALDLGGELDALVTYDQRLAEAARAHGITVVSPS